MARTLGDAFVRIRPDTMTFPSELKQNLAKTNESVNVAARLDTSKLTPSLDKLKADLKGISVTKAKIDADASAANAKVKGLKVELGKLSERVKIDGDTAGVKAKIAQVKEQLASVSDVKANLSVSSAMAQAQLKRVQAQMKEMDGEDVNIDVNVNKDKEGGFNSFIGEIVGGFQEAGAAMSKIITIGGAAGPAAIAVGSALSAAASGGTALATAIGPAAAAGGAVYAGSLAAIYQGAGVLQFAFMGLTDAVGGDKKAMQALTPEGRALANQLKDLKPQVEDIRTAAQKGLFPGVADATSRLATAYLPLLKTAAEDTGNSLGDLARRAGRVATSGPWKRDFATVTATNSHNMRVMGTIGLSLADVLRNLLVTSLPLTTAFLRWGAGAARALQGTAQALRDSGALSAFWQRAAVAGATLGRIMGNIGVALFNIFRIGARGGAGADLLSIIEGITARFREWTGSANGAEAIARWFAQGRVNLVAIGKLVGAVIGDMSKLGQGQQLAPLVDMIRTEILPPLNRFLTNASTSGALGALISAIGRVIGVFADLEAADGSVKAFAGTLTALANAALWITNNVPGASTVLGTFFTLMGASQAIKIVGLGGVVQALGKQMILLASATGRATAAEKLQAFWSGVGAAKVRLIAIATRAWAGVQWLLNAAMTANPIGIVVVALVALGVGLVIAYKKSETFRKIVNGALHAVSDAAGAVVGWFKRSFIPFFTRTIPNAFQATVSWVRQHWPVILAILTGPIGLATLFITRHWDTITRAFRAAKDWAVGTFKRAWANVRDVLAGPVDRARDAIRTILTNVRTVLGNIKDWALSTFKRAWAGLREVFTNPVNAAKDVFQRILGRGGPIRSAFSAAVDAIGKIWRGLQALARKPVEFIVNTVYMRGLRALVDKLPGKNPLPAMHFETGGPVRGGTPGRDSVPALLMPNEHVWTAREVAKAGGHQVVESIRKGVRRFAGGGPVWPTVGRRTSTYAGHDGVDINQPPGPDFGAPIFAWRPGRISYAGWGRGYGHAIFEKAAGFPEVVYGHSSQVHVRTGQMVRAGQVIGNVGATGNASGPHLHFGVPGGTFSQALGLLHGAGFLSSYGGVGAGGTSGGGGGLLQWAINATKAVAGLPGRLAGWTRRLGDMGGGGATGFGSIFGRVLPAMVDQVKSMVTSKIGSAGHALGSIFAPNGGSGGVARYAPVVTGVLKMLGAPQSVLPAVMHRMMRESGGRADIVNKWDSNWAAGHPSVGLMQVIGPTFRAYAGPYRRTGPFKYGTSINPTANIYAALNYAKHRYGSVLSAMNQPGGYDFGGLARGAGAMLKRTIAPERVLSPRQTGLFDRMVTLLETAVQPGAGGGGSRRDDALDRLVAILERTGGGPLVNIEHMNTRDDATAQRAAHAEARKALTMLRVSAP